ncbi:MAG: DinB family protein [Bacteroidota bacterium]|nr:DinB family protein [Bacteroidota bacterium]
MDKALRVAVTEWLVFLKSYSLAALQYKPQPAQWSIGQLYLHLIGDTTFYLDQAAACFEDAAHINESCNEFAQKILSDNAFPDIQIEGHPNNQFIPQPGSKQVLQNELEAIGRRARMLAERYATHPIEGKSLHPGFGYLSLPQWLQLAALHFNHHLRQKQRLDALL